MMQTIQPTGGDDTGLIQAAITANYGSELVLDGVFHTTAPLSILDTIAMRGTLAQGDGARGYHGIPLFPIPADLKGSAILPGLHDTIRVATNKSVLLEKFQVSYALGASSGNALTAIKFTADPGATNLNTGSKIRDICTTNADHAIRMSNCANFEISGCALLYSWVGGLILDNPNYPSCGDGLVDRNTFWGGAVTNTFHILLLSHGGLRIFKNTFIAGGANVSNAIQISPNYPTVQHVEPLLIDSNTIEGPTNGIAFSKFSGPGDCSQVSITANQIWAGKSAIYAAAFQGNPWITGLSISGGSMTTNGGPSNPAIITLDGVSNAVIDGIDFNAVAGPVSAIRLGAACSNIVVGANAKGAGVV